VPVCRAEPDFAGGPGGDPQVALPRDAVEPLGARNVASRRLQAALDANRFVVDRARLQRLVAGHPGKAGQLRRRHVDGQDDLPAAAIAAFFDPSGSEKALSF